MDYLFAISISLSLLFALLLLSKKEKGLPHILLGIFFLLASLNVSYLFAHHLTGGEFYVQVLSELHFSVPFLYGTIIYFYARSSIEREFELKRKHLLHLTFFIVFFVFLIVKSQVSFSIGKKTQTFLYYLKPAINVTYLLATMFYLVIRKRPQSLEPTNRAHRNWLLWLVIGGLVICAISITGYILYVLNPSFAPMKGDYFLGAFLGMYFFVLGFVAFKNRSVFENKWASRNQNLELSKKERGAFEKFLAVFVEDKLFLNPQLSLYKLSEVSEIPAGKLSRLIRQNGHVNFYDFVNSYRVAEVKERMFDEKYGHLNLLGIALDSGFNSKASFNRIFKKFTGQTPSDYREQNLLQV